MQFSDFLKKDEILKKIEPILKEKNAYLVGGYLRNYFLNNEISSDKDIVATKEAKELALEISEFFEGTFVELDKENEIYRVVLKDKTTYFDVARALDFDIETDIKRRDLTINSIFYDFKNEKIIDILGGISDIENKILRTYSLKNLEDDPLRLLRVFRFMSKTGFDIENSLLEYIKENFGLINKIAKERINYEIIKMFEGEYIEKTLLEMLDLGVLEVIFPFVKEIKKVPENSHHHLDLIHHSIETVRLIETKNPILKIAAFFHDIGKPSTWTIEPKGRHRFIGHDVKGGEIVKSELQKLNFSNKQISYISKMVANHIYPASLVLCSTDEKKKKKAYAKFFRKMKEDTLDVIALSKADRLSARGSAVSEEMLQKALLHLEDLKKYYFEMENMIKTPKSLLSGDEIMEILNLKPSKKVGEVINSLIEAQISKEIQTKEEAINFIKNLNS